MADILVDFWQVSFRTRTRNELGGAWREIFTIEIAGGNRANRWRARSVKPILIVSWTLFSHILDGDEGCRRRV